MTDFETTSSIKPLRYPTHSGLGVGLNPQKDEKKRKKIADLPIRKKQQKHFHTSMRIYHSYKLRTQGSLIHPYELTPRKKTSRSLLTLSQELASQLPELSNVKKMISPQALQKQIVCHNVPLKNFYCKIKTSTSSPTEKQKKIYHKKLLKFPNLKKMSESQVEQKFGKEIVKENIMSPRIKEICKISLKPKPKFNPKLVISCEAKLLNLKGSMNKTKQKIPKDSTKPITGWTKNIPEDEVETYLKQQIFEQL